MGTGLWCFTFNNLNMQKVMHKKRKTSSISRHSPLLKDARPTCWKEEKRRYASIPVHDGKYNLDGSGSRINVRMNIRIPLIKYMVLE